jgi:hypothetical protein
VTATNASPPPEGWAPGKDSGKPVPVFVINGVRVSTGEETPGLVHVPPAEAGALVAARVAVHGENPPRGWNLGV